VIAVECTIAGAFVLLAAAGVTGSAWILVLGYAGHGLKDFWQERSHYVAGTTPAPGGGRRSAPPSTGSSPSSSPPRSLPEPDFITSQATGQRQTRVDFGNRDLTWTPAHPLLAAHPDRLCAPGGPSCKRSLVRPGSWRTNYPVLDVRNQPDSHRPQRTERRKCVCSRRWDSVAYCDQFAVSIVVMRQWSMPPAVAGF
jgi:hypothetical protein